MIMQTIKLQSSLPEEEIMKIAKERVPQFKSIPGLIQKYYVKGDKPGQYSGVYIWDSEESLMAYRNSDLAASIPVAYKLLGPPEVEVLDILFQLRK